MANSSLGEPDTALDRGSGAREIARRNWAQVGRPLSAVMKTAATARELARDRSAGNRRRDE